MRFNKYIILFLLFTMLTGCMIAREIIMPDGITYIVKARTDDMVTFKKDGTEIIVDGRGRPGILEQILAIMFINLPDVTVGKD